MIGWSGFEDWKQRRAELVREAQERALAREARKVRETFALVEGGAVIGRVEVRWGRVEDEAAIVKLLDLNGMPRWIAFEERFIVAVEHGVVVAALRYRTESKRLILGLLVVDPWAGERRLARALYARARDLGREIGVREVVATSGTRADYPAEAGYRRRGRAWRWDASQPVEAGASETSGAHTFLMAFSGAFLRRRGWR